MERNTGGAKPKTSTRPSANNSRGHNRQHRSPRRESTGNAHRSTRGPNPQANALNTTRAPNPQASRLRSRESRPEDFQFVSTQRTPAPYSMTRAAAGRGRASDGIISVDDSRALSPSRRPFIPNSVARGRARTEDPTAPRRPSNAPARTTFNSRARKQPSSTSTTSSTTQAQTQALASSSVDPLDSVGGTEARSVATGPVLRQSTRCSEPEDTPPSDDLPRAPFPGLDDSLPPFGFLSNSNSHSSPSSSSSPPEEPVEPVPAMEQLAALRPGTGRPISSSRDAALARELLQAEMDMMMERDEEMARQLQREINDTQRPSYLSRNRDPSTYLFRPTVAPRLEPTTDDSASSGESMMSGSVGTLDGRPARFLRLFRGPDGAMRMGFEVPGAGGRGRGLRVVMNPSMGRGRGAGGPMFQVTTRSSQGSMNGGNEEGRAEGGGEGEAGSGEGEGAATSVTTTTNNTAAETETASEENSDPLPFGEFDPDERLLEDGAEAPDDFLSVMHDPSLMLLMLLLRAPDTMEHNQDPVDLDDYDGLWELAERLGEVRRRGMTDAQIRRLPTRKFREGSLVGAVASVGSVLHCQICLVDFENGDCLRNIPCRHDFHKDCIDQWLQRNATCPICRDEVKAGKM